MAQAEWGSIQAPEARTGSDIGPSIVNWLGALMSLTLIAGLAIWGYKLAVRDVSGVPVVRALEGPMRVQPEDPGGENAAHQGFAVNAVQADGQAAAPAERLVLAPAPVTLEAEDTPAQVIAQVAPAMVQATPMAEANEVAAAMDAAVAVALTTTDLAEVTPQSVATALAEAVAEDTPILTAAATAAAVARAAGDAVADIARQESVIPASVPGVNASPRPAQRPETWPLATSLAASVSAAASAAATSAAVEGPAPQAADAVGGGNEVVASSIPVGTRLVQLGAYDSEAVARAEWARLADRFDAYFDGKSRVVQMANSGGKTFYRLRAIGFEDLADARRFCSVLMAGKAACIPVVTR